MFQYDYLFTIFMIVCLWAIIMSIQIVWLNRLSQCRQQLTLFWYYPYSSHFSIYQLLQNVQLQQHQLFNILSYLQYHYHPPDFTLISGSTLTTLFCLDAVRLARSQYQEGPETGHLDTGFSWFPCVLEQMLGRFPILPSCHYMLHM